ncbi:hypothetical protein FlaCF_1219 [Flavobacterium tructae]
MEFIIFTLRKFGAIIEYFYHKIYCFIDVECKLQIADYVFIIYALFMAAYGIWLFRT